MYVCSQEAVRVSTTVIEHGRSAKVIVFKKKRRKNYKRKRGRYTGTRDARERSCGMLC